MGLRSSSERSPDTPSTEKSMTATPPIVDRETWQKQIDTQRVREKAHTREGTRLPRLAGGCRWSRSTRRRRWSAPPARSRSSTPSRSRSQQFALGSVGGSACETDLAECATWISFGSRSSSTLTIRSRLVDGGPRPWDGLSWATPRTSSRSGRLRIGCRACCSCRFRRRRQARTDSILTSVRSIKPQKSNVSFPSVLGGPMSGSVTRRGWYSPTLKAMSFASLVDGFGPILRSR